jgi:hypothetical protein
MGGGASSSSSPPIYNAQQATDDQTKSNVDTANSNAVRNNVNQVTPYGSLTYDQSGGQYDYNGNFVPSYTATQTLSPTEQTAFDQTTALQGQARTIGGNVLDQVQRGTSQPLNFDNAPAAPANEDAVISKAYDDLMSRFNTQHGVDTSALDTQLRNQGVQPGTEAWDNAFRPLGQQETDAQTQAELNATALGGQQQSQALQLRNQAIGEDTALYSSPLQTYATLLGLGGGVQNPSFTNTPQTTQAPVDTSANDLASYQGELAATQQQLQAQQATQGGLFGLGGSVLGGVGYNASGIFGGLSKLFGPAAAAGSGTVF